MTDATSIEDRVRTELDRMRADAGAAEPVSAALLARARRAMAATVEGLMVAAALVVGGSVLTWRAFGGTGSERQLFPADTATMTPRPSDGALVAGPLSLPSLAPGDPCPTTSTTTIVPGTGTGFSGPVRGQE